MFEIIEQNMTTIMMVTPIVVTIIFYQLNYVLYKHTWRAIHFTVQMSSIFYVITVVYFLEKWTPFKLTGYVIIAIILMICTILVVQWRKETEVVLIKALKFMSRILFLICFILYIVLVVIEIVLLFS